jgi:hypothetical protein
MSLYPRADLNTADEGFIATCSDEEALKVVEDSAVAPGQIVNMLGVDMSLGKTIITLSVFGPFLHVAILA